MEVLLNTVSYKSKGFLKMWLLILL